MKEAELGRADAAQVQRSFARMRHARLRARIPTGAPTRRKLLNATALIGVALTCLTSGAQAQTPIAGKLHLTGPTGPAPDDGLGPRDMMLEADTLVDDRDTKVVTAKGHVEARMGGRTLRADELVYNTVTGVVHAQGHAVVINADGSSEYGRDILGDDQFRAAVAYGFAVREPGNVTIVAGASVRRNETIDQLNDAVYTACNICAQNGAAKTPTWSIQASRIIQDRDHHVIYYRNAVVRILGVPIFYAPVFWHPDPTAPARSGLLAPKLEYSKRRGFSYEQPYALILSPSADLIVSPQFNSRVNPFVNLEYTQRTYSGLIDLRAGVTYSENFDNHNFFDHDSTRSYLLGRGLFDIDPHWVWGFGAERVSDPTLFQRYGVHNVYTDRGPYPTDTNRLISQLFTTRQDQNTFVSIAALDFQSLAVYGRVPGATPTSPQGPIIGETSKAFPVVGPLIEARYDPTEQVLGGTFSVQANTVSLTRNDRVLNVTDPSGVNPPGAQEFLSNSPSLGTVESNTSLAENKQVTGLAYTSARRASAEAEWKRTFTFDDGLRVEPFVVGRGDLFSISDSVLYRFSGASTGGTTVNGVTVPGTGTPVAPTTSPGESTVTRGLGTIGANLSWPFIKTFGAGSLLLEPLAQIVIAPTLRANPYIPNEDSVSFEYDETNLFSINRFAGYDLLESGQRLNVGGRATVDWGGGRTASAIVGRTFRAESDPAFTQVSGLQGTASDWVTAINVAPVAGLSFFSRARLDADTLNVRRDETGVNIAIPRVNVSLRYDYNQSGYSVVQPGEAIATLAGGASTVQPGQAVVGLTQDATVSGQVFLTRHWGFSANVSRDLQHSVFPVAQFGLVYTDECIRVDVLYTHDETFGTVIGNSNSVTFRLTLTTLGDASPYPASRQGSR